jgi:hypothetical protein
VDNRNLPATTPEPEAQTPTYILGGLAGLLLGLTAAFMFRRTAADSSPDAPPVRIKTGDVFRVAMTVMLLVRQVAELGTRPQAKNGRRNSPPRRG